MKGQAVRGVCGGVVAEMEGVRGCVEEVVMRIRDLQEGEGGDGDVLVGVAPGGEIPVLESGLCAFLEVVELGLLLW